LPKSQILGFDFDLTLADSRRSINDALDYAISQDMLARKHSLDIPLGTFTLDQIIKQLNVLDHEKFKSNFKNIYLEHSYKKTLVSPNCVETLTILSSLGCKLVLISAKLEITLLHSLNYLGLNEFFSKVVSVSQNGIKEQALIDTKVDTYIGDTQSDIDSANKAGCQSIYYDYYSEAVVTDYRYRISNLSEVLPLVTI
jgi:phosphoglycolate phosphatase-like HAD superfamily hydrolase